MRTMSVAVRVVRHLGARVHGHALAAMRATISAQRDGEADPLYYLCDELSAPENRSGARGGGDDD